MRFLIDENLPKSIGQIFTARGFEAEFVSEIKQLRTESDEVIFNYARENFAIIVTRDINLPIHYGST